MELPTVELLFRDVAGNPWQGSAEVRFQGETAGPFPVREGLTSAQRNDLRWYVEDFMMFPEAGNATRAREIEQSLKDYGLELWDGLRRQAPMLDRFVTAAQMAKGGRLELRANTPLDKVAFRSPWELMRVGGGTLLHQLGVTVVRRGKAHLPSFDALDTSGGLRVLAIVCRPDEAGFLDPRYTPEAMLEALKDRPEVSVDFCRPGTLEALVDELQRAMDDERPYHAVHFDGHGTTLPHEAGIGALCFEHADESLHLVRATEFGDLMSRFRIPLVVLEACRTSTKALARETVAGALLKHGVGSVVAMGHAVHVDMTRKLMEGFYESLARGRSVGDALQAGRNKVYASPARRVRLTADAPTVDLRDWFVPQLYQAGADPVLLEKKPRRRRRAAAEPLFHGFGPEPRAGFHGRGRELHRLERLLVDGRAVVVHGPGGMGKTTIAREAARWWIRTGMFPDGAIFVSLEGNPSPDHLIVQTGVALEGHEFYKRPEDERRTWLADQLAERRLLLIWDNFESALPTFQDLMGGTREGEAPAMPHASPLVFLSHSSADKTLARQIATDLKSRGIRVWFDEWEILGGDSISQKIDQGLGDAEAIGILWEGLGVLALNRNRPSEAIPAFRQALDAFVRAGDDVGQMEVLNSLGEVDRRRGHTEAALEWYERSLERASQLGDLQGQATARGNRAILLSDQAEAASNPATRSRLLNKAIAEGRECLAIKKEQGYPAGIALSHNNLANMLRLAAVAGAFAPSGTDAAAGSPSHELLDEAEQHARTALAIREQLNDPETWKTIGLFGAIAEARGDTASAAQWRARKEAAHAESQRRAGTPSLPADTVAMLLSLALTARTQNLDLPTALASAGAPDDLLAQLGQDAPWLAAHLTALATGARERPVTDVPASFHDLLEEAWTVATGGGS